MEQEIDHLREDLAETIREVDRLQTLLDEKHNREQIFIVSILIHNQTLLRYIIILAVIMLANTIITIFGGVKGH